MLRFALVALLLCGAISIRGQTSAAADRYWYNRSCTLRAQATLVDCDDSDVVVERPAGTRGTCRISALSAADREYLAAYRYAVSAVAHLDRSPYRRGDVSLHELNAQLVAHKLAQERANHLTHSFNTVNDRDLESLADQWVEIRGARYRVASVAVSPSLAGIHQLVVELGDGRSKAVTPQDTDELRILGSTLPPERLVGRWPYHRAFQRRGPPHAATLLPEYRWKYSLVYDPYYSVWTDSESARGHRLLALAAESWQKAGRLELIASARWRVHRGKSWARKEKFSLAIDDFSVAISNVPNYSDAFLQRGLAYRALGRQSHAVQDLSQAIRFGERHQEVLLPSLEARASISSELRKHDDAIADARRAQRLSPQDDRFRRLLFDVRTTAARDTATVAAETLRRVEQGVEVRDEEFETAIAAADKALKYNPDAAETRYGKLAFDCRSAFAKAAARRARLACDRKEYDAAIELAKAAVDRNPDRRDQTYNQLLLDCRTTATRDYQQRATRSLKNKAYSDAVTSAQAAVRLGPSALEAESNKLLAICYRARGWDHLERRNYASGGADASECIKLQPEEASGYMLRALCGWFTGDFRRSADDLTAVVRLGDASDVVYELRAHCHASLGHNREAIAKNPGKSELLYHRARVHLAAGDDDTALADATKAIELDNDVSDYYLLRSRIQRNRRDFKQALADVDTAIRLNPDSKEARQQRKILASAQRSEDPYFFDKENLNVAITTYVAAGAQEYFKGKFAEGFRQSETLEEGLSNLIAVVALTYTEAKTIDHAIFLLWPNLPRDEKAAINTLATNVLRAAIDILAYGKDPRETALSGLVGAGIDLSREGFQRFVESQHPQWKTTAQVGDFLFGVYLEVTDSPPQRH